MKISRKKIFAGIMMIILLVAVVYLAVYLKHVSDYKQSVRDIVIADIDISGLADGTYTGECDVDFVRARVKVVLHNGEITNIDLLEHKNERGKSAEAIIDRIIDEQKIDVDAISGATNSSIVIKKAVEKAITKGGAVWKLY